MLFLWDGWAGLRFVVFSGGFQAFCNGLVSSLVSDPPRTIHGGFARERRRWSVWRRKSGTACAVWQSGNGRERGAFVLQWRVLPKKRGVGRFSGGVAANFFVAFVCWFVTFCNGSVSYLRHNLKYDLAKEMVVYIGGKCRVFPKSAGGEYRNENDESNRVYFD